MNPDSTINQEEVREWIKLLRSSKYEQGKEALRSSEKKFCCLGVYCDGRGGGKWDEYRPQHGCLSYQYRVSEFEGGAIFLPLPAAEKIGCSTSPRVRIDESLQELLKKKKAPLNLEVVNGTNQTSLIFLNDNGFSFEEIADVLERGLLLPAD